MPNCGIHAARSTNWKAGADGELSKPAHSTSDTANASIAIPNASQRISPSFVPSRLGMTIRTRAPMIGNVMASVSRPITLSPQVIREDGNHPGKRRRGVGLDRPVLQQAQHDADAADEIAGA